MVSVILQVFFDKAKKTMRLYAKNTWTLRNSKQDKICVQLSTNITIYDKYY